MIAGSLILLSIYQQQTAGKTGVDDRTLDSGNKRFRTPPPREFKLGFSESQLPGQNRFSETAKSQLSGRRIRILELFSEQ